MATFLFVRNMMKLGCYGNKDHMTTKSTPAFECENDWRIIMTRCAYFCFASNLFKSLMITGPLAE